MQKWRQDNKSVAHRLSIQSHLLASVPSRAPLRRIWISLGSCPDVLANSAVTSMPRRMSSSQVTLLRQSKTRYLCFSLHLWCPHWPIEFSKTQWHHMCQRNHLPLLKRPQTFRSNRKAHSGCPSQSVSRRKRQGPARIKPQPHLILINLISSPLQSI